MFVTLKVFKLIGPSNDGRRQGRGTYLFTLVSKRSLKQCLDLVNTPDESENCHLDQTPFVCPLCQLALLGQHLPPGGVQHPAQIRHLHHKMSVANKL
jgi:hypothetical protein